jgi:hypothetical protein
MFVNIASGVCTGLIVLSVLWLTPKVVELLGLPNVVSDVLKLIIGAIPWIFTGIRNYLRVVLPTSTSVSNQSYSQEVVRWAAFSSAKLFMFGQLLSFLLGTAAGSLIRFELMSDGGVKLAFPIMNISVWVPIMVYISTRYGVELYKRRLSMLRATSIFLLFMILFCILDTMGFLFASIRELYGLEGMQIYLRAIVPPVLLTLSMMLGWAGVWVWHSVLRLRKAKATPDVRTQPHEAETLTTPDGA